MKIILCFEMYSSTSWIMREMSAPILESEKQKNNIYLSD